MSSHQNRFPQKYENEKSLKSDNYNRLFNVILNETEKYNVLKNYPSIGKFLSNDIHSALEKPENADLIVYFDIKPSHYIVSDSPFRDMLRSPIIDYTPAKGKASEKYKPKYSNLDKLLNSSELSETDKVCINAQVTYGIKKINDLKESVDSLKMYILNCNHKVTKDKLTLELEDILGVSFI